MLRQYKGSNTFILIGKVIEKINDEIQLSTIYSNNKIFQVGNKWRVTEDNLKPISINTYKLLRELNVTLTTSKKNTRKNCIKLII